MREGAESERWVDEVRRTWIWISINIGPDEKFEYYRMEWKNIPTHLTKCKETVNAFCVTKSLLILDKFSAKNRDLCDQCITLLIHISATKHQHFCLGSHTEPTQTKPNAMNKMGEREREIPRIANSKWNIEANEVWWCHRTAVCSYLV